ncbi:uncharacterized protein C4orf54 homolog isoform X2 [Echeneis naucrates]|uniref:uncharacterized protein C4orf54 homolog isoform X2 n=1 Tax=Echeneis naucrates TaxID=173247 RepID=UPI0011137A4F|nr:uncharacterized protein C4orf54-like isoform X2 [Echeneis naucrates]
MKTRHSRAVPPATLRGVRHLLQKPAHKGDRAPGEPDERKYVDLRLADPETGRAAAEKDCSIGDNNQMSVLINSSGAGAPRTTEPNQDLAIKGEDLTDKKDDSGLAKCAKVAKEGSPDAPPPPPSSVPPCLNPKTEDCLLADGDGLAITQPDGKNLAPGDEDRHCIDEYLGRRSESDDYEDDDDVSSVLSDDCVPFVTGDESHYITTHEIQLSELSDHDGDYDLSVDSSNGWDIEDDNQVYSFVDYAPLDAAGAAGQGGHGRVRSPGAAAVSTLLESDLCEAAKLTSSNESVSKPQQPQQQESGGSSTGGQIHLSIRTTSRAINDPRNIQEEGNTLYHARRSGGLSHYVFRGVDGKGEKLCDRAKSLIAAPGRLHFGGKLLGKEVTGYSSGTSSAVSELDEADKEVRNLTARAFKSLACPDLDAINFNTSSDSSASEHGLGINRWSTFVDLKYGNMNISGALDPSVVSNQNSAASFEIAKSFGSRGYKGIALASMDPPTSRILTLAGTPHGAASSTNKIELMGKFSQGHSGVIRLTETLNFRCNVNSGMSGVERGTNFAQNAAGSRSPDEVTNSVPSSQSRGASKPCSKTMEDTHKKAIFASSLIKNVISKKMQFEQERKMERGEISEPHQTPSPSCVHQEGDSLRGKGGRELRRQSSRFSESGSDYAIMCVDELGDFVDSGSCDTRSDSRRQDLAAALPQTHLEPGNEVGIDTKKGSLDASKSTLLRSQNSAFRCWKDEELEFQKDNKTDKSVVERASSAQRDQRAPISSKLTKMSHLFVPSIHLLPSEGETGQQLPNRNYPECGDEGRIQLPSDNTLYVADSRSVTKSKSPEIKINLRSVNKSEPFGVSRLRAPSTCSSLPRTDDFKCQALASAWRGESSDKVPHFMVRDIRDNKGKLQTPIHQVRDVRKLVKSSYHFVSLDNNENKSSLISSESHQEPKIQGPHRTTNSVSPIVIKCQSVNTNTNGKPGSADITKPIATDRSSPEGARAAPQQWAAGKTPTGASSSLEESIGLRIESRKQEKTSEITEKKPESKMANQAALEKLQAAVKTMEQLYVFEKNEWKRKNEPQPLTDSHVLSLLASEEQGRPEDEGPRGFNADTMVRRDSYPKTDKMAPGAAASLSTEGLLRREDRDQVKTLQSSSSCDNSLVADSLQTTNTTGSKNVFSLSSSLKASTTTKVTQPNMVTQTPSNTKNFIPKSPKLPVSLKIRQPRIGAHDGAELNEINRSSLEYSGTPADSENYLTIPSKSLTSSNKQPSAEKTSAYKSTTQTHPNRSQEDHKQTPRRSSIVMEPCSPETSSATIYHSLPLGISTNQPQVYCFSPAITPAPTIEAFQATQRKMLLDPTTGNYYLVETPVQPATKRLFDPETGQYIWTHLHDLSRLHAYILSDPSPDDGAVPDVRG